MDSDPSSIAVSGFLTPEGNVLAAVAISDPPGGEEDDVWFVDNLIGTISIAADLEDRTWNLALRVAPEEWWDRRTADLAAPSHGSG
jgi:hypothetical protein